MMLVGTSSAWAVNLKGGEILYFKPNDNWKKDGARFAMFLCNGTSGDIWIDMTSSVAGYYKAEVPTGDYKNIIFCRMNGGTSTNNWDNRWNQTADLTFNGTKDIFVLATNAAWDGETATWYQTTKSYVLHGSFNNYTDLSFPASVTITAGTHQFKVKETVKYNSTTISDNWYGNIGTMTRDNCTGWTMTLGATDCQITADANGVYNFTFDSSTKKVSVTYPAKCTSATYSISFAGDVTSIDKDATIQASVTPSGNGYGTVTWESGTTSVATIDASGVITGVKFGTSTITATVADGDTYCGGTDTEAITVKETPTITIDGETVFCGESTTLTATIGNITGGNSYDIKWYEDGNNTAKGTGFTFSPTKSGTYIVKVTGDFVNETSETVEVTKKAYPTAANFTVTNNTYTYDGAAKAATVKWTDNQSAEGITVTYNPTTPKDAGIYDIQVTTTAHGDLCASNGAITLGDKLTINKADQTTALTITASTNICGKEATFSVTGGDGTGDYSYSLDKNDAGVSLNGTTLTATQNGSVTLKVKKLGDANYNESQVAEKAFTFTMPIEDVKLAIIKGLSASGDYCVGTEIQLKLTYTGATPANDGKHFEWVKDGFSSEIGNNEGGIATGATWTTTLGVNDKTLKVKLKDCNGGWVESNELTFNVFERPRAPKFNPNYMTVCQGQAFTLPGSENEGYIWSDAQGKPTTPNKPSGIDETSQYYAVISFGCPSDATLYTVNVNKIPTITGASVTQTNKEITLESAAGADTEWSVSPAENVTLTDNSDGTATFVATANGDYTITASNGVCAPVSHTIKVSDAFYIWVRNAKESDTAYGQFYYPNENSEAVRGGAMFYAECDALPTKDNYTTYNRGGRKADIVNDDCDGYTWYGFKASADVIAGTKYFYVHATNDLSDGGYYTHSKPLKSALSGDVYYTLGTTGASYSGWNLSTASAPYAGPKVHASGSTTLGANKFAALYVTDCSGKEIDAYQWEYSNTQNGTYNSYSASVSNSGTLYSGNAGTTNNIRPSEAGWYRCKVTYDDASNATSEAVQVTGTYSHESGSLPVFVVNTNGEGFPVNDCSGTPSKNADDMKAKVSVDVKIYQNETMVYDRKARMNYRGSSSLNFLKKSYAFCPGKANCVEDKGRQDYVKTEKMNMLNVGSAEDKDWVLYAAAPDPSLMRNRLVFDTYKEMTGKWGVSSRFVKLYVDGTYKGIYVLMDKITNNKKRVNITHADGFIVKFDKTDKVDRVGGYEGVLGDEKTFKTTRTGADDLGSYDTSIDQRFEIEYPEKDDYPTGWSAKVNSIKAMFEGFENALEAKDFATVQKYIDYDSWADWFIISEYAKNVDAYRASCIFVYNGDKIEATPLWDQELSFNNQTMLNHGNNDATGLLVTKSSIYEDTFKAPFWFTNKGTDIDKITGGLLSDPCFVQVVKEKWNQYSTGTGALTADALNAKVAAYTTELDGATDISFNRSTIDCGSCNTGCFNGETGYSNSINKSGSITAIDTWIKSRGNGLTTAINKLTGASFSIQILPSEVQTTPWEATQIAVNVTPEGYDYVLEYTDNNLGGVTNIIIEENGNEMTYRIPRPASWSTGDEATEGERADIEYGIKATLNVASGTIVCGSQAAPTSTAKIILQDEPNENCPQP